MANGGTVSPITTLTTGSRIQPIASATIPMRAKNRKMYKTWCHHWGRFMFFRKMRAKYTSIIRKLPSAHAPPIAKPTAVETSPRISPAMLMSARISQPEFSMLLRASDGWFRIQRTPLMRSIKAETKPKNNPTTIAHGYESTYESMTYPIPPPTSGAVTKFHPNVARCTFRTPLRIFRSRDLVVFFARGPRLGSGEGSEAIPFILPRREVAATKFTGGNVSTQPVGVKRLGCLGEKKSFSPQIRVFPVILGVADHGRIPLRRDAAAFSPPKINCQKFIEKPREFIDIYRIVQYFRIALSGGGSTDPRRDSRASHR